MHAADCRGWLTKGQLLVLHGGNEPLVDSIIRAKVAAGHCKPHPDLPDDPEATLIMCPGKL